MYANATHHFLRQSKSLDPICGWQTLDRGRDPSWDLPSGTPDYTLHQEQAPSQLVPIDGARVYMQPEDMIIGPNMSHQTSLKSGIGEGCTLLEFLLI